MFFNYQKIKMYLFFTQWFEYLRKFCDDIEEDIVLEERTEEEIKELDDEIFEDNKKLNQNITKIIE